MKQYTVDIEPKYGFKRIVVRARNKSEAKKEAWIRFLKKQKKSSYKFEAEENIWNYQKMDIEIRYKGKVINKKDVTPNEAIQLIRENTEGIIE